MSFTNLVEAYVLRALRQNHNVSITALRTALDYAEQELSISRLLMKHDLLTTAGDLFLQYYGNLINLSQSGQLAMRKVLDCLLYTSFQHSLTIRMPRGQSRRATSLTATITFRSLAKLAKMRFWIKFGKIRDHWGKSLIHVQDTIHTRLGLESLQKVARILSGQ